MKIHRQLARIVGSRMGRVIYAADLKQARAMVRGYWHPERPPGVAAIPFVYERPDAPHLRRLAERFGFKELVAGAADEYQAMLQLGTWLGGLWDHGKDDVPRDGSGEIDLVRAIEEGMRGRKYWCEIAGKVAVQAFTAMGWPARLLTTSRDGSTWEHAVMEAWSNQFGKWFAMDTDFNVVYESDGVPLSGYELCHDGPALQAQNKLTTRLLGQPKPALPLLDLVPFYFCIYIDLRSDWHTRKLRRASPAGGDVASWWTARPEFRGSLAPKIRVDDRARFDWPVHAVWIRLHGPRARVFAYSPFMSAVQVRLNGGEWRTVADGQFEIAADPGRHVFWARVVTCNGDFGNPRSIEFTVPAQQPPGLLDTVAHVDA